MAGSNPWGGIKLRDITRQCTFSWQFAPTQITGGTFPDSFIDGDHETKLEFYETYTGADAQVQWRVALPKLCFFMMAVDIGVGAQRGSWGSADRKVYADIRTAGNASAWQEFLRVYTSGDFSMRMGQYRNGVPIHYGQHGGLQFWAGTDGEYAFEIFQIRIIEIVGV